MISTLIFVIFVIFLGLIRPNFTPFTPFTLTLSTPLFLPPSFENVWKDQVKKYNLLSIWCIELGSPFPL